MLLRSIIVLNRPTDGTIRVFGREHQRASRIQLAPCKCLGRFCFRKALCSARRRSRKTSGAAARIHARVGRVEDESPPSKLSWWSAGRLGAQIPVQLSGGMKKRAGLAALALDPELVFLASHAGLDPLSAQRSTSSSAACRRSKLDGGDGARMTRHVARHDRPHRRSGRQKMKSARFRAWCTIASLDPGIFSGPRGRAALNACAGKKRHGNKS